MFGRRPVQRSRQLNMDEGAGNLPDGVTEEVLQHADDVHGWSSSIGKGLAAIKSRLLAATANRVNMEYCFDLGSTYFSTWVKFVAEQEVREQNADDGWGEAVAERSEEVIAVFGACSMDAQAREATASFFWDEIDTANRDKRTRHTRDASSSSDSPVLDKKVVARTGSFVVFKHRGMNVRGVALWFILYLPPKGTAAPLMKEFKDQVVILAYVHVAILRRNCLVVRVRQHLLVRCPPRLTTHSSLHSLCTRATTRSWTASHTESCAQLPLSATGTPTSTHACRST